MAKFHSLYVPVIKEAWHITDFSLTSTLSYSHEVDEHEWKLEPLVVNYPKTDLQEKKKQKK